MGMERTIAVEGDGPSWGTIRDQLAARGVVVQMRMVDNMPAFPDEEPEASWRELRVSLGNGMITVRREPGRFRVIVWGNADESTQRDQEALANAIGPS